MENSKRASKYYLYINFLPQKRPHFPSQIFGWCIWCPFVKNKKRTDDMPQYRWACFFITFLLDGKLDNLIGVTKRTD